MATTVHKCSRGTCFSLTGAPQCAHAKATTDTVVLRLLDESDPNDLATHRRDLVAEFWRDMGALARKAFEDAKRERLFAQVVHDVREEILAPVTRAAQSYGAGAHVPLVALRRLRSGCLWPV